MQKQRKMDGEKEKVKRTKTTPQHCHLLCQRQHKRCAQTLESKREHNRCRLLHFRRFQNIGQQQAATKAVTAVAAIHTASEMKMSTTGKRGKWTSEPIRNRTSELLSRCTWCCLSARVQLSKFISLCFLPFQLFFFSSPSVVSCTKRIHCFVASTSVSTSTIVYHMCHAFAHYRIACTCVCIASCHVCNCVTDFVVWIRQSFSQLIEALKREKCTRNIECEKNKREREKSLRDKKWWTMHVFIILFHRFLVILRIFRFVCQTSDETFIGSHSI